MTHDSGINASSVTGTHSQFNLAHFEDLFSNVIKTNNYTHNNNTELKM